MVDSVCIVFALCYTRVVRQAGNIGGNMNYTKEQEQNMKGTCNEGTDTCKECPHVELDEDNQPFCSYTLTWF